MCESIPKFLRMSDDTDMVALTAECNKEDRKDSSESVDDIVLFNQDTNMVALNNEYDTEVIKDCSASLGDNLVKQYAKMEGLTKESDKEDIKDSNESVEIGELKHFYVGEEINNMEKIYEKEKKGYDKESVKVNSDAFLEKEPELPYFHCPKPTLDIFLIDADEKFKNVPSSSKSFNEKYAGACEKSELVVDIDNEPITSIAKFKTKFLKQIGKNSDLVSVSSSTSVVCRKNIGCENNLNSSNSSKEKLECLSDKKKCTDGKGCIKGNVKEKSASFNILKQLKKKKNLEEKNNNNCVMNNPEESSNVHFHENKFVEYEPPLKRAKYLDLDMHNNGDFVENICAANSDNFVSVKDDSDACKLKERKKVSSDEVVCVYEIEDDPVVHEPDGLAIYGVKDGPDIFEVEDNSIGHDDELVYDIDNDNDVRKNTFDALPHRISPEIIDLVSGSESFGEIEKDNDSSKDDSEGDELIAKMIVVGRKIVRDGSEGNDDGKANRYEDFSGDKEDGDDDDDGRENGSDDGRENDERDDGEEGYSNEDDFYVSEVDDSDENERNSGEEGDDDFSDGIKDDDSSDDDNEFPKNKKRIANDDERDDGEEGDSNEDDFYGSEVDDSDKSERNSGEEGDDDFFYGIKDDDNSDDDEFPKNKKRIIITNVFSVSDAEDSEISESTKNLSPIRIVASNEKSLPEDEFLVCIQMLDDLFSETHKNYAWPFFNKTDHVDLLGLKDIFPPDLLTISKCLVSPSAYYTSLHHIFHDVINIFKNCINCKTENIENLIIINMAKKMQDIFITSFEKLCFKILHKELKNVIYAFDKENFHSTVSINFDPLPSAFIDLAKTKYELGILEYLKLRPDDLPMHVPQTLNPPALILNDLPISDGESGVFQSQELNSVCSGNFTDSHTIQTFFEEEEMENHDKRRVEEFLDNEAELSGEDDGDSGGRDNSEDDDEFEELIDNKICVPEEELREEISDLYAKQMNDIDHVLTKKIQEDFLPDGDLNNITKRSRKYAWRKYDKESVNVNELENDSENEKDHEENIDMEERLKFIQKNDINDISEGSDDTVTLKPTLKINILGKSDFQPGNNSRMQSSKKSRGSIMNLDEENSSKLLKKAKASAGPTGSRTTKSYIFSSDVAEIVNTDCAEPLNDKSILKDVLL